MKTREYNGLLALHSYGEESGILFLSSLQDPLAEELLWMSRKEVTVRYWITDRQCTRDEAQKDFLETVFGRATVDFGAHYSELTGYLWTDENFAVGGHDMITELSSHVGEYLYIEVEGVRFVERSD